MSETALSAPVTALVLCSGRVWTRDRDAGQDAALRIRPVPAILPVVTVCAARRGDGQQQRTEAATRQAP